MYDAIVIGGGPAGLTAAYHLAKQDISTALFERLSDKGILAHPCGCMISPLPGLINCEKRKDGIYFKELDFFFNNEVILANPRLMQFESASGLRFEMRVTKSLEEFPVFQFDKAKVLKVLTERAIEAGATLHYNSPAKSLVKRDEKVEGVVVRNEIVKGRIIISAEGLSRRFANEAGLYTEPPKYYFFISGAHFDGLNFTEDELGQCSYLGSRYLGRGKNSGILHTIENNEALILLAFISEEKQWNYEKPISGFLDEYIENNDFLKDVKKSGKLRKRVGCRIIYQKPAKLVANGFIGIGDSVAPLGHSSNAIAMLMGKEAALLAGKALNQNDFSEKFLSRFNKWLKSKLFKGSEFEAKMIAALLNYTDNEIDRVCESFQGVNLEPFFIGTPMQIMFASLKLMFKPKIWKNWKLLKRMF